MDKLKVLYLLADCGHDLTLNHGYKVHVWQIIHNLKKLGHDIFLMTVNNKKVLPDFDNYLAIRHRYVPVVHRIFPYSGLLDSLRIFRVFKKIQARSGFDLIHERYGLYSLGGVLIASFYQLPYILEVNAPLIEEKSLLSRPLDGAQGLSARFSTAICLKKANIIVTVSQFLKRKLCETWQLDSEKVLVLPNAADSALFKLNGKSKDNGLREKLVIGYLGTLQPWFGIENLLYAFERFSRQHPEAILQIVGDGMMREELLRLATQLKIDSRTFFVGEVHHMKIGNYLKEFDIAVAPYRSLRTGFYGSSMKVFEYMAAGKAIVASRIGQIEEILAPGKTALLVEPSNANEIAQAISYLANNPKLREILGNNAREVAKKDYTWEQYAQKLESIYQQILSNKACAQ